VGSNPLLNSRKAGGSGECLEKGWVQTFEKDAFLGKKMGTKKEGRGGNKKAQGTSMM